MQLSLGILCSALIAFAVQELPAIEDELPPLVPATPVPIKQDLFVRTGGARRLFVMRHGGSKKTEAAVELALDWLTKHQDNDGHWDSAKLGADPPCDVANTSLGLLCLLAAGHTECVGKYKERVQSAVAWLSAHQLANGWVHLKDGNDGPAARMGHALAGLALAEAAIQSGIAETLSKAKAALSYTLTKQLPGGGWSLADGDGGDVELSAWIFMQLRSATAAGLEVNPHVLESSVKFLASLEGKGAEPGVQASDEQLAWIAQLGAETYDEREQATKALAKCGSVMGNALRKALANNPAPEIAIRAKQLLNGPCSSGFGRWPNKNTSEHYNRHLAQCCAGSIWLLEPMDRVQNFLQPLGDEARLPVWTKDPDGPDLLYWHFASLALREQGGDLWKRWNQAQQDILLENQCPRGDDAGSWDPSGQNAKPWGRVGQTALACLCLETYYRYSRVAKNP